MASTVSAAVVRLRERLAIRGVLMKVDLILVKYQADFMAVFSMADGVKIARKNIVRALWASGLPVAEISDLFACEAFEVRAMIKPDARTGVLRAVNAARIGKALAETRAGNLARGKAS